MARNQPSVVYGKIASLKLLPLFNVSEPEICISVIDCCYEAGIHVFELTNRDEHALAVFQKLDEIRQERWPGLCLGAGTIMDIEAAATFTRAGADFIIAPDLNLEVGKFSQDAGLPWIPGVLSPTEIKKAYDHGAEVVKLFPAGTVGPSYIKHIHGPMPFAKIIVTGGVASDEVSLRSWLDAGVYAIGLGSSVFRSDLIKSKDFVAIGASLKKMVSLVSEKN
jgi:2-dehydro-3-deoxyphosphogluconate aldolase / (4S)-4-hydroxy-2-oxoglutarate aldolase